MQHLAVLPGLKLEVSINIEAMVVLDNTVRTVLENCRTLKFEISEFEEE